MKTQNQRCIFSYDRMQGFQALRQYFVAAAAPLQGKSLVMTARLFSKLPVFEGVRFRRHPGRQG